MTRPALLAALLLLPGCAREHPTGAPTSVQEHVAKTPHGGQPVDLGDYNLEAVVDEPRGSLEIYVLDDDMENFIRITQPRLNVTLNDQGATQAVALSAVPNPATGETVGDTSYFQGTSDWIKTHPHFQAVIERIAIRGSEFPRVSFSYPP